MQLNYVISNKFKLQVYFLFYIDIFYTCTNLSLMQFFSATTIWQLRTALVFKGTRLTTNTVNWKVFPSYMLS